MKIFRNSVLALLFIAFVSCSGDDDDASVQTSDLTGEWNLQEMDYSGTSTVNFGGTTASTSYSGELISGGALVTFNDDNTWTSGGSYTIRLTTNMEGMTDVQDVPVSDFSGSGTYSVNGNKITTTQEEYDLEEPFTISPMGIEEATISELTADRLVLTFDYAETTTMNGMEVEITMEGYQVLTR